jgi:hypothetical protein
MPRVVGALAGLAYAGALFGLATGGFALAETGSAKAAAVAGAAAGVFIALLLGLVASGATLVVRRLRPEAWEFGRAWSEAGFWCVSSWWGLRRFRQMRRQIRLLVALRNEWLSEAGPRPSARQFLAARRQSIEERLYR